LFRRASPLIDIDDDDVAAGDAATGDVGGADSRQVAVEGACTKNKKRKNTSDAWNDFENIDGKQVRTGAKCFHCGKYYAARSCIGTGHLNRHVLVCSKRKKIFVNLNLCCLSMLMVMYATGSTVLMLLVLSYAV
jgi:hypothetical protein